MSNLRTLFAVPSALLLAAALFVATQFAFCRTVQAADGFLVELEDLPLAPGLTESAGGMVFDAPTGRIVDAYAEAASGTTASQIIAFYAQTLPELGWEKVNDASYRRDKELLHIDVDAKRHPTSVHFSVVPQ